MKKPLIEYITVNAYTTLSDIKLSGINYSCFNCPVCHKVTILFDYFHNVINPENRKGLFPYTTPCCKTQFGVLPLILGPEVFKFKITSNSFYTKEILLI